jgi:hypothetical protein
VGRLRALGVVAVIAGSIGLLAHPASTRAGGGSFSDLAADATFGVEMTFSATWNGADPDYVELLLGFADDARLVVPVALEGGRLAHVRDMTDAYAPPNTVVAYQWRAVDGDTATLSPEREILYDDDRSGLDWDQARIGSATVHWYRGNEGVARRFGDLAGDAADRAGELLGASLADPIDIFVYETREEFLGAVGPAAREWIGAATYPNIRTVFMWLEAGSSAFLDTTIAHEVTHVVFHDASDNPYHEPPSWLNEGTATWAELGNASTEEALVRLEAGSDEGLMAFEALTAQFPIDARGASLAYAQGATMVDHILATYGDHALAAIMAAYRDGATDDEAIEAGTGADFADIRAEYFDGFGVAEPEPIEPNPLADSDVPLPPQPEGVPGGPEVPAPTPEPQGDSQDLMPWLIIGIVVIGGIVIGALVWRSRRPPAPPAAPGGWT